MKALLGVLMALATAGGTVLSVGLGMDMRAWSAPEGDGAHACCPAGSQPEPEAPQRPSCCLFAPGHLAQAPVLAAPDRQPLPVALPAEPGLQPRNPGSAAAPSHGPPVQDASRRCRPVSPRAPPLA